MPRNSPTPVSIHDVASQRGKEQEKGDPQILASSLSGVVQAQKDGDGAAARISQGETRLCVRLQHLQWCLRADKGILFVHSGAPEHPFCISAVGRNTAAMFWSCGRMTRAARTRHFLARSTRAPLGVCRAEPFRPQNGMRSVEARRCQIPVRAADCSIVRAILPESIQCSRDQITTVAAAQIRL